MIGAIFFCYVFNNSGVRYRQWVLGVVLVLLGCAGPEVQRAEITTVVIQPVHEQIDLVDQPFTLIGRLAVNTKQQKFSGGMRWQHTWQSDEIYLFSSLGQVVAEILRDQAGVRLTTSEPAVYRAQSAEYLTGRVLGWELPLAGLQFWVRGNHYPGTIAEKDLDVNNHTVAIRQDGWNIVYRSYYPEQLPRLLEFSYQNVKMKLIVDHWGRIE
jgi:outer membrane lipoprotein LolB